MALTNRQITERAFAALGRRDLQTFLELIDPGVEPEEALAAIETEK
jgi:ketosteroid isomerase-like protein